LPEALEVCAAAGLGVNIEIKALPGEPDADSTPELIDRLLALTDGPTAALPIKRDDLLVTSFWPATIDTMVARSSLATGWLTLDTTDPPGTAQRLADQGHSAINPWDPLVSAELVAAAHANGLRVNVWTVNDPVRMVELASWGVDGIITDVPDVAVAALSG